MHWNEKLDVNSISTIKNDLVLWFDWVMANIAKWRYNGGKQGTGRQGLRRGAVHGELLGTWHGFENACGVGTRNVELAQQN